jgi:hypothetical protein
MSGNLKLQKDLPLGGVPLLLNYPQPIGRVFLRPVAMIKESPWRGRVGAVARYRFSVGSAR